MPFPISSDNFWVLQEGLAIAFLSIFRIRGGGVAASLNGGQWCALCVEVHKYSTMFIFDHCRYIAHFSTDNIHTLGSEISWPMIFPFNGIVSGDEYFLKVYNTL